jgi:hypothetical protein
MTISSIKRNLYQETNQRINLLLFNILNQDGIKVKQRFTNHNPHKENSKLEKKLNLPCKKVKNTKLKVEKKAFHYVPNQLVNKNHYQKRKMASYRLLIVDRYLLGMNK